MIKDLKAFEAWFIAGSQHLYGDEVLKQVDAHSKQIAGFIYNAKQIPVKVRFKAVVKSTEEINAVCKEANGSNNCIGIIAWMHTFSPAKMWIGGLKKLQK